ncbi:hypothetical protein V5O48_007527 [Marasmius crinis-equi]|uniref:Protein kinase domain-containing protein n=1 Tax=Marasmius crinis-equi TaxID=585013 RepID=A0ABR3FGL0_9AGAR
MSTEDSTWISATFQSSLRITDVQPDAPGNDPKSTEVPTYDGQIASFVFLVAGLEKAIRDDTPILFDNIEATFGGSQTRVPIASGATSTLERAKWQKRGNDRMMLKYGNMVALKFVRHRRAGNMDWKHILLEIRALLHQPIRYHPNIVRMLGLSWGAAYDSGTSFPVLALELAELGTLEHLQINERLPFNVKKRICWDVSKGLSILHACGVVHGDLKHENVLIFKSSGDDPEVPYLAKLADFGGSVMDLEKEGLALHMGTPPYDAPEARTKLDAEGIKCTDVYSLGLLVWRTLIDGAAPFSRLRDSETGELTPAQISSVKRSPSLLPLAKESIRSCSGIDVVGLDLMDFVLENTIQPVPKDRNLVNAIAGLQAKSIPEISELKEKAAAANRLIEQWDAEAKPGQHGITQESSGLFLAKYAPGGTYDYQDAGPGHRPVLDSPNPGEMIFDPQRMKRILNWSIQREVFLDLVAAADARPDQHATQIPRVLACFFLFQCYCHEFGTVFDAQQACHWLKEAALSGDECQENYLAQAWCWRVHRALGVRLDVEHTTLRDWMFMSIIRGHRKCIEDAKVIAESMLDSDERTSWDRDVALRVHVLNTMSGGIGMPYFAPRKLRRQYDLDDLDALDRDIQEEFQLRGIASIDEIFVNHRGDGLLHYAASMGYYSTLKHLVINYQPNIDLAGQARQETPLLSACRGGHLVCALFLLDQGANPEGDRHAEETPLDWLCAFSVPHMPIIADRLVRAGAKIDHGGHRRSHTLRSMPAWADFEEFYLLPMSPLSRAVMMNSLPAVRTLLALGANPLEKYDDRSSVCPIVLAAVLTLPAILETMLAHLDAHNTTPISIFDELEILQIALDLKATVHDPVTLQSRLARHGEEYKSAMDVTLRILHDRHKAHSASGSPVSAVKLITRLIQLGREDLVASLLELGHSIRDSPEPIVEAVKMNHEPLFHLLIQHGADITTQMRVRGDAHVNLLQVVAEGQATSRPGLSIAEYLITHGLPVDPPTGYGSSSPFAFAVMKHDFDLANLLLTHGADMDFRYLIAEEMVLHTVLGEVARRPTPRNVEALKYLLNVDDEGRSLAGTSRSRARGDELPNFIVREDWTALQCTARYISRTDSEKQATTKMVRLMLSVGKYRGLINYSPPSSSASSGSALLFATVTANLEAVSELLEKGADVNIAYQGLTPSIAIQALYQSFPNVNGEELKLVYGEDKVSQQLVWRRYGLIATLLQSRGALQSTITE